LLELVEQVELAAVQQEQQQQLMEMQIPAVAATEQSLELTRALVVQVLLFFVTQTQKQLLLEQV
jgi:hypothetical protein